MKQPTKTEDEILAGLAAAATLLQEATKERTSAERVLLDIIAGENNELALIATQEGQRYAAALESFERSPSAERLAMLRKAKAAVKQIEAQQEAAGRAKWEAGLVVGKARRAENEAQQAWYKALRDEGLGWS